MSYQLSVETVYAYKHEPEKGSAADAARERQNRLRTAGVGSERLSGPGWAQIKYTDPLTLDTHTLIYTDTENQT